MLKNFILAAYRSVYIVFLGINTALLGIIVIIIHEPIPVDGYSYGTKEALMEKVRQIIGSGLNRALRPPA